MFEEYFSSCTLCPRECKINRFSYPGQCRSTAELKVARAALHMWEEPCISGEKGSGTVFFSGCPLSCIYCQNSKISRASVGKIITPDRLCEIFFELYEKGAENINLVTPTHFVPQIIYAIKRSKSEGLKIPFVYNTSGYEKVETLKMLDGLIDVYLPDFKYFDNNTSVEYSNVKDYPTIAKSALQEMYRQTGKIIFDKNGMIKKGIIVRHLVLPGESAAAKLIINYIHKTFKDNVYISIMSQYTPVCEDLPDILKRKLTEKEYESVIDYAVEKGIKNAFTQYGAAAEESFIPNFDNEGV